MSPYLASLSGTYKGNSRPPQDGTTLTAAYIWLLKETQLLFNFERKGSPAATRVEQTEILFLSLEGISNLPALSLSKLLTFKVYLGKKMVETLLN